MTVAEKSPDYWFLDSGASHHLSSKLNWFSSCKMFDAPRPLRLLDGRCMYTKSIGDIQVEIPVTGKWNPGFPTNVWYVPESGQLFSSGTALDKGLIEFADNKQREFRNKNGATVAVGIRYNGVYKLLIRILVPEPACVTVKNDLLQFWHERMGQQNKRLSFGSRQHRPSSPGQLVHADVCGPMPEKSLGGNRYFVAFKDDYSKYRTVYLIKKKYDIKEMLSRFLSEMKNAGYMLKELLTDGGGEFNNSEVHQIIQKEGLSPRTSMPYTPEQNGVIASYVPNRTGPTPEAGNSPYEIWFERKHSVDHLNICGTECFIHIPKQKSRKLDKKAIKGYFVGYCGEKHGYRIWIPDKNDVVLSRDVVFKDEITSEETSIEIVQLFSFYVAVSLFTLLNKSFLKILRVSTYLLPLIISSVF
ncbi:Retrovirus-related Pol polyprotein from transposon TNT 1-94 [Araneus ventricosus]|uniref:Retrovirus-related Pol polyprotein from transposon TNT 1-94 n=1 Tax=Araneus ventricosus TaxID=182803 RepID=A0A4Y2NUD3_ARAVE|nr:Retrovirus-related Pol polyprotein from transposon TNT 1-94 [Araneus ventricosus]